MCIYEGFEEDTERLRYLLGQEKGHRLSGPIYHELFFLTDKISKNLENCEENIENPSFKDFLFLMDLYVKKAGQKEMKKHGEKLEKILSEVEEKSELYKSLKNLTQYREKQKEIERRKPQKLKQTNLFD